MKRVIKAISLYANKDLDGREIKSAPISKKSILTLLRSKGIDTTIHRYEIMLERYERYTQGDRYKVRFKCPGDWLAYFAMLFHEAPTAYLLEEWYGDLEEFEEIVNESPTVEAMESHAAMSWWGDGGDLTYYLENLDTGEILYSYGDIGYDEYEDEEDYWEEEE